MQAYKTENYFSQDQIDTLLVDITTYIGARPKTATSQTRFEPEFRKYYTASSKHYRLLYFFANEQGDHFFYLLRPARHTKGNQRGVGGRFSFVHGQINDFEEIFNTPVFDEDKLIEIGKTLFLEMIEAGNVDKYLGNKVFIEWPDGRLKYHKELNEWRYDLELNQ